VSDKAEIKFSETVKLEVPVVVGSEQEKAIDIAQLRAKTGYVTIDPAFMNTASTKSAITFIDGDKGILRYRGIPIEQLAEKSTFVETSYLLIQGHLPNKSEFDRFSTLLTRHSLIHEDMKRFYEGFPSTAHPMAVLSSMVLALSTFYPQAIDVNNHDQIDMTIARLLAKVRTIAAFAYKKSIGQAFVYPKNNLRYCANFLNMMFSVPAEEYEVDPEMEKVMNLLLILHADHEQNCSTSTVRLVGSSRANLFASISAGICALWGPLHGGANQEVLEMLQQIHNDGGDVKKYVALAKDKDSKFRLMGFGHRVYKNFDPRAKIIKTAADQALTDPYFIERKLYPNVDFYSGIIYRAMGFPTDMFTVLFALGRLPGWIAHWKEMMEDTTTKIGRPRQIYTGQTLTEYVPLEARK
jgi:citrate synthase